MYKTEQKPKIVITQGYYHIAHDDKCPFLHLWTQAFDYCYAMNGKKARERRTK